MVTSLMCRWQVSCYEILEHPEYSYSIGDVVISLSRRGTTLENSGSAAAAAPPESPGAGNDSEGGSWETLSDDTGSDSDAASQSDHGTGKDSEGDTESAAAPPSDQDGHNASAADSPPDAATHSHAPLAHPVGLLPVCSQGHPKRGCQEKEGGWWG